MLETFCNSLSDEAQLKIAIRLTKLALPVWHNYFNGNPMAIDQVNRLIGEANRLKRGADKIDIEFPQRALEKIERSYFAAKEQAAQGPIPIMKRDATLSPMLATIMQPLTNKQWDTVLPQSVKLVFTSVFNTLVWIQLRRRNAQEETHIFVAINQAADVLLRESLLPTEAINKILEEYGSEKRSENEDNDWESTHPVGETEPMDQEDVYRKILGEEVNKDLCGRVLAKEVLRQMHEEGKSYWDEWTDYISGTSITYSYNKEEKSFWRTEFDSVVGSFFNEIPMTEGEMLLYISRQSLIDLRKGGFEI